MRGKSSITDTMIICSGNPTVTSVPSPTTRQRGRHAGPDLLSVEGELTGEWVLVDMGSVIVHVMQDEYRDFYQLENSGAGAAQVNCNKGRQRKPKMKIQLIAVGTKMPAWQSMASKSTVAASPKTCRSSWSRSAQASAARMPTFPHPAKEAGSHAGRRRSLPHRDLDIPGKP